MNAKGNIWLAVGKRNVGKTYTALQLATEFSIRGSVRKHILVYDHTNNSSYNTHNLIPLTLEQIIYLLPLQQEPIRGIVRGVEIDEFCEAVTHHVSKSSILFDDCGVLFRGNLTIAREKLLKTPKNNGNELIFQAHSIREIAPALLEQANMYILKQTVDDPENLPPKLIARREIGHLLTEVIRENYTLESNQKWATRIYDTEDDEIWIPDSNGDFTIHRGEDYFPFSYKNKYLQ
ncbi:hypothetical protein [Runella zeae]|uniref:hypothetical protein n=1 Tax=Runella zeae TaxID=94255 RepID=UPI0004110A5A|nr:hypothetical protein [Runella zeae]